MTKRLIKTYDDHKKLRAMIDKNTATLIFSPVAGALTAGVNGVAYTKAISVTNNVGAVVYSISAGSLPTGLTLNPTTGVISGTPTQTIAAKAVTVKAVDKFGNVGTAAYTLTITAT